MISYLKGVMLHTTKARLRSGPEDAYYPFLRNGIFHLLPTTGEPQLHPLLQRYTIQ